MALIPKDYLVVETFRDVKFNMKASCSICTETFDTNAHIPKVLECGHSFCVTCIISHLQTIQVSYSGDGEANTAYSCPICRRSMAIPSGGASNFPNNHQLLDAIASQDSRYMTCTSCKTNGSESTFHICRQCTITSHEFDIQSIIDVVPPVNPDDYAICSTCILKHHNTPEHTVIEYLPVRIHHYYKRNQKSVNVLNSQMIEKFSEVRIILSTMPKIVEKNEIEVDRILDLMQRAKSRQGQDVIFEKYKHDMNDIIAILDMVKNLGGTINSKMGEKAKILEEGNERINGLLCFSELPNLNEILKISENSSNPFAEELRDSHQIEETTGAEQHRSELITHLADEHFHSEANVEAQSTADQPKSRNNDEVLQIIGDYVNEENFWNILVSTWETIVFNSNRLYRILAHGALNNASSRNNYNQELVDMNPFRMVGIIIMVVVAWVIFRLLF